MDRHLSPHVQGLLSQKRKSLFFEWTSQQMIFLEVLAKGRNVPYRMRGLNRTLKMQSICYRRKQIKCTKYIFFKKGKMMRDCILSIGERSYYPKNMFWKSRYYEPKQSKRKMNRKRKNGCIVNSLNTFFVRINVVNLFWCYPIAAHWTSGKVKAGSKILIIGNQKSINDKEVNKCEFMDLNDELSVN